MRVDFRSGKLNKAMGTFLDEKEFWAADDLFFFFTDLWSELIAGLPQKGRKETE